AHGEEHKIANQLVWLIDAKPGGQSPKYAPSGMIPAQRGAFTPTFWMLDAPTSPAIAMRAILTDLAKKQIAPTQVYVEGIFVTYLIAHGEVINRTDWVVGLSWKQGESLAKPDLENRLGMGVTASGTTWYDPKTDSPLKGGVGGFGVREDYVDMPTTKAHFALLQQSGYKDTIWNKLPFVEGK